MNSEFCQSAGHRDLRPSGVHGATSSPKVPPAGNISPIHAGENGPSRGEVTRRLASPGPMRPICWRGVSKSGIAATGEMLVADVAAFVERWFRNGWRWLDVYDVDHGEQVGGICVVEEMGKRTWWGERSDVAKGGSPSTPTAGAETGDPPLGATGRSSSAHGFVAGRSTIEKTPAPDGSPRPAGRADDTAQKQV